MLASRSISPGDGQEKKRIVPVEPCDQDVVRRAPSESGQSPYGRRADVGDRVCSERLQHVAITEHRGRAGGVHPGERVRMSGKGRQERRGAGGRQCGEGNERVSRPVPVRRGLRLEPVGDTGEQVDLARPVRTPFRHDIESRHGDVKVGVDGSIEKAPTLLDARRATGGIATYCFHTDAGGGVGQTPNQELDPDPGSRLASQDGHRESPHVRVVVVQRCGQTRITGTSKPRQGQHRRPPHARRTGRVVRSPRPAERR